MDNFLVLSHAKSCGPCLEIFFLLTTSVDLPVSHDGISISVPPCERIDLMLSIERN